MFSSNKQQEKEEKIFFTQDCTPMTNTIRKTTLEHWHLLQEIPGCSGYRHVELKRTQSLQNILVRTDTSIKKTSDPFVVGHYKCGKCSIWQITVETKTFKRETSGLEIKLDFYKLWNKDHHLPDLLSM